MKRIYLIMMAVMAILSLNGCSGDGSKDNPDKPNTNLPDLKVSFSSDSFTCNPGETMSLPYTITNIQGAQLSLSAKCSSSECKVSVSVEENFQGSVTFVAPAYSDGKPVTVTLEVSDPANKRNASATASVTVNESDPLTIAVASGLKSIAIKPNGSIDIPFDITGAISKVSISECKAENGWNAQASVNSDNKSGVMKLTAPGSLTNSVTASLSVKDENNRTASLSLTLSVDEISTTPSAANSYIVAPGSSISIKAVKGNSTEAVDFDNASLLWQDALGMVKSASGNGSEGVIVVSLNPNISGNAVIAAKKGNAIVWSWHLWVTDFDPEADPFIWKNSKGDTYTFMDRNLGAMNNKKYDAGAFGLMYQWGRKDPFESGSGNQSDVVKKQYDIDGNQIYPTVKDRPVFNDHKTTSLDSAIANPMVFYTAPSSDYPYVDWLTNDGALQDHDLWGGVSKYKTKYDPCPTGWRVPDAGTCWGFRAEYKKSGKLTDSQPYDSSYPWYIEDEDGKDTGFRYKDKSTGKEYWFPFCGRIQPDNGTLMGTGSGGHYHTRSVGGSLAIIEGFAWGNPNSESELNRPYGAAVRCIKE